MVGYVYIYWEREIEREGFSSELNPKKGIYVHWIPTVGSTLVKHYVFFIFFYFLKTPGDA